MKAIIKPIVKKIYRRQAGFKLSQLRNIKNPTVDKIENAIYDALNDNLDPEEKKWIDRIEEKRRALNRSSIKISITDFGAGSPNHIRAEDEMYQGVVTNTTVGEVCQNASKPYFWSLLLFKLVRKLKPANCIELGTCLGISGAYQASALKLNKNGRFITLEGAQALATLAEKNFQQFGLDNAHVVSGRFQDNLDRVLAANKPIDYAFIDGHHDEKATISYFETFIPYLSGNSIIVFDDISWSDGMRHAWEKIEKSNVVKTSLDLKKIGICVLDENTESKYSFRIPII